ncbi:MAG: ABC transporter permease [Candidatus Eisenbacteria bacterium]
MRILRIVREGMQALGANKLRTFFMMAGTIVGIAALTVIMAMGKGTEKKVMERVNNFGIRAIMVTAGGGKGFSPPQEGITTLQVNDAEAIAAQISGIEIVAPFAVKRGMSVKGGANQIQTTVMAVGPEWHDAWEWYAAEGDPITAEDTAAMARVCVLGTLVAKDLFGEQNPISEYIQVANVRFMVKGILQARGVSPMGDEFDRRLIIPLTTGLRRLFNQDHITNIRVKVKDSDKIESIATEINQLLHERHHITPPEEDDFAIFSATDIAKMARGIAGTLSILLIALAGLSLIVGGIVLMNILLISVSERVKEIGLRRALGATQSDIFQQFLSESLAITLLGMLLGCALGWGASTLVGMFAKAPVVISWEPFALAVVFSLMVGLFFGIQPARRAARLKPIEALR